MRRSIDDARDDHPEGDDERPPVSWAVALSDDCDGCGDLIQEGDDIQADGEGGWVCETCGVDLDDDD